MRGPKKDVENPRKFSAFNQLLLVISIFLLVVFIFEHFAKADNKPKKVAISEIAKMVAASEIKIIEVDGLKVFARNKKEELLVANRDSQTSIESTLLDYGATKENLQAIEIKNKSESPWAIVLALLPFIFPILIILLIFWMLSRNMKGGGMQAFSFGQSKARIIDPNDKNQRITFKDVAGVKTAKDDLEEMVEFLKNPKKFLDIGAVIPKGVILMGAPGTGKTMLARAVAGEAGVPFFYLSGSEFIEMFVGVGASRVRDLFAMAKKASPAIIFIDEIDAIGRARGGGTGGGNDEREQTLNQILVEMDGFEKNEKVIVMAATNRPDVLDAALVRPGRFDRRVTLDLPDKKDRKEILEVQSITKPKDETVDLQIIAERTIGFSGADIYSLMNEAAISAARANRKSISQKDILNSIEKVILGPERKNHLMHKKERELTAYHEAGHALVGSILKHSDPVHKVSIISRGNAGGYTMSLPDDERKMHSKNSFLDEIAMTLGGYATEELIYGEITTGPSGDLQSATSRARDMVMRYGMSDLVGPRALETSINKRRNPNEEDDHSQELKALVDREIERIVREQLDIARGIVKDKREILEAITKELLEKENLERAEFETILTRFNIPLKKDLV